MWNAQEGARAGAGRYFMSGENLTTQSGIAVQQDLALVNLIGLKHVERNGHHYVNGMMDLPEAEQAAFLVAHRDLYERRHGAVRLRIRNGELAVRSLAAPGFASGAYPDWTTLAALPLPARGCSGRGRERSERVRGSCRATDWLTALLTPTLSPQRAGEGALAAPFVEVASAHQRADLAVGDAALQHPEAAVGMDVSHAARAEHLLGALDRARDCVGATRSRSP